MPTILQLRRVRIEELADEFRTERRVFRRKSLRWTKRPAPCVLVVIHVVTEPCQTEHVMEIIPRDAAKRVRPDHAGDNDAEFLVVRDHSSCCNFIRQISSGASPCCSTNRAAQRS